MISPDFTNPKDEKLYRNVTRTILNNRVFMKAGQVGESAGGRKMGLAFILIGSLFHCICGGVEFRRVTEI